MEITPLDVELPVASLECLKRYACRIQKTFPFSDGTKVKLSAIQNAVARALGYPSFSHVVEAARTTSRASLATLEFREERQHLREICALREVCGHIGEDRLSAFLAERSLVS